MSLSSLSPAVDRYLSPGGLDGMLEARAALGSLVTVLESVADPRRREARQYSLASMLALLVLATLAGCRSLRSAVAWAGDLAPAVVLGLGFGRGRLPVRSTLAGVMAGVDMAVVAEVITGWLADRLAVATGEGLVEEPLMHVAVDGKALRGARHDRRAKDGAPPMQLAVFAPEPGVVLATAEVDPRTGKGGEGAAVQVALDQVGSISGWVVTGDAAHTTRSTASYLRARGAHYVLAVKANRSLLQAEVAEIPWSQVPVTVRTSATMHGRDESRAYQVVEITTPIGVLGGGLSLPGARQAIRVTATRRPSGGGPASTTVPFYVTSLGPEQATFAQIAHVIRTRWGIENRLHWIRDVVFDEDRHTTRRANTTRLWTLLRSTAISLIHLAGLPVTATTQACYRQPERTFALVR